MKKNILIWICLIGLLLHISSVEKKVSPEVNIYGGRTIEYILSPHDQYGDQIKRSYYFYNNNDELVEIFHEFTDSKANEFGFKNQSERFKAGVVTEFKLELTDDSKKIKGISWQIERVDAEDNIYEYEYSDGINRAKSNGQSFVVNYPFYTLPYLEEILFEDYEENKNGDAYTFSAEFWKSRTFIEFTTNPIPINENDRKKVYLYLGHLGQEQHTDVYSHKIKVKYLDKEYNCYLQNNFVNYIKENDKCLLTYQLMGINKELILLATEFDTIE
jgi:hypothetical protein